MGKVGVAWSLAITAMVAVPAVVGARWLRNMWIDVRDDISGLEEWAAIVEGDPSWQERRPARAG